MLLRQTVNVTEYCHPQMIVFIRSLYSRSQRQVLKLDIFSYFGSLFLGSLIHYNSFQSNTSNVNCETIPGIQTPDLSSEMIICQIWYCLYSMMLHLETDQGPSSNRKEQVINGGWGWDTKQSHKKNIPRIYTSFNYKTPSNQQQPKINPQTNKQMHTHKPKIQHPHHFLHFGEQRTWIYFSRCKRYPVRAMWSTGEQNGCQDKQTSSKIHTWLLTGATGNWNPPESSFPELEIWCCTGWNNPHATAFLTTKAPQTIFFPIFVLLSLGTDD